MLCKSCFLISFRKQLILHPELHYTTNIQFLVYCFYYLYQFLPRTSLIAQAVLWPLFPRQAEQKHWSYHKTFSIWMKKNGQWRPRKHNDADQHARQSNPSHLCFVRYRPLWSFLQSSLKNSTAAVKIFMMTFTQALGKANNLCTQQKSDVSTVIGWSWLLTEEVTDTKQLQVMKGPQKTKSSNLGFTQ